MPKYLVVECEDDTIFEIIDAIKDKSNSIAICSRPPPIWSKEREKLNSEKDKTPGESNEDVDMNSNKEINEPSGNCEPTSYIFEQANSLSNEQFLGDTLKTVFAAANEAFMTEDLPKGSRKRTRVIVESPITARRRQTETNIVCGLCSSKMTLRASYGRTRLREHVMRHLALPTVKCGHCDFKGTLREHVRRHYLLKHKDITPVIIDLEPDAEYYKKFEEHWNVCYPTIGQAQVRLTSQRPRTDIFENMKEHEEMQNVTDLTALFCKEEQDSDQ